MSSVGSRFVSLTKTLNHYCCDLRMGCKASGPVCRVTHVKEPGALIKKKKGIRPVFLVWLAVYCATAPWTITRCYKWVGLIIQTKSHIPCRQYCMLQCQECHWVTDVMLYKKPLVFLLLDSVLPAWVCCEYRWWNPSSYLLSNNSWYGRPGVANFEKNHGQKLLKIKSK